MCLFNWLHRYPAPLVGGAGDASASISLSIQEAHDDLLLLHGSHDRLPDLPQHISFSTLPFLELQNRSTLDGLEGTLLAANGCLSIPDPSVIDEFVKQYFSYVHPSAILIDEAEFWKAYDSESYDGVYKMPLVLFQAMLFASAPYVDISTLQRCGFVDKRAALYTLYNRSKVLAIIIKVKTFHEYENNIPSFFSN